MDRSKYSKEDILAPRKSFFNTSLEAFRNPRPSRGFSDGDDPPD